MTTTVHRPKRPLPILPSPRGPEREARSRESLSRESRSNESRSSEAGWHLLAHHRGAVLEFLRRRCRDEHQAEDLAHDTLLRAARCAGSLARVERPRAWLIQIAVNVQRDLHRRESRVQLRPPSDAAFLSVPGTEPVPGDEAEGPYYAVDGEVVAHEELLREVHRAWHDLGAHDRDVLGAYYREGGSTRGAAEAVGVTAELAKVRLFRARKRLETELRRRLVRS